MPHLHLPIHHTDADLVLAANLADVVGSEDLYVTWSYESGPGAIPEVDAVLVERRELSPWAEIAAAFADLFRGLFPRRRGARAGQDARSTSTPPTTSAPPAS
jgi:hypothetical protein